MKLKLSALIEQQNAKLAEVNKLYDEVGDNEPTADQIKQVSDLNKEIEDLGHKIKDSQGWEEGKQTAQAAKASLAKLEIPGNEPGNGGERKSGEGYDALSLGDLFVNDPEIKNYFQRIAPHGVINDKVHVQTPAIPMHGKSLLPYLIAAQIGGKSALSSLSSKALVTGASATSAGALIQRDLLRLLDLPWRPLVLRDLVTNGSTESDTIEYPVVSSYTNAAAPTAEATASSGSSGTKPESALALTKNSTTVKTIAHWIPASKRALSDAGQMRTLIDNFLMMGLAQVTEDQMVAGDGTGENLLGILNTPGISVQAFATDNLTTTRKMRTVVRLTGRATPTAYAMNPLDWEGLDLLQNNEGNYFFGGPTVIGNPRLWGLPVVEAEAVPALSPLCGDFRQAVVWDREQANISATDSHSDFFVRNLVAILAELRLAFGILRPGAICKGTLQ